ncbi:hypothetical protein MTO96_047354 [Rhipicephalus appendiculatus]
MNDSSNDGEFSVEQELLILLDNTLAIVRVATTTKTKMFDRGWIAYEDAECRFTDRGLLQRLSLVRGYCDDCRSKVTDGSMLAGEIHGQNNAMGTLLQDESSE